VVEESAGGPGQFKTNSSRWFEREESQSGPSARSHRRTPHTLSSLPSTRDQSWVSPGGDKKMTFYKIKP